MNINQTKITEFLLLGLDIPHSLNKLLFFLILILYLMTLSGNFLIIVLFLGNKQLHLPMYFFLSQLSICDILLCTNVVPNLLCTLLGEGTVMSVTVCITQHFACCSFSTAECFLLTVMCYDRYLAICNPLRYVSIMNFKLCFHLVIQSWMLSLLVSLIYIIPVSLLEFCGYNVINYIYCDLAPLLEVTCSDTTIVEIMTTVLSTPIVIFTFFFIILTYVNIFLNIFKITSTTGRQKAFSTCSSHLTIVSTYYGILTTKYIVPSSGHLVNMNKIISLFYTTVTPLLNPIIYSLRNKDIRSALNKWISTKVKA